MMALLHYDPKNQALIGVWLEPAAITEQPEHAYAPAYEYVYEAAKGVMDAKVPRLSWREYFENLSDQQPRNAWWEVLEVQEGRTALEVLLELSTS